MSFLESVTNQFNQFFDTVILPRIQEFLIKEKNVNVSVEELRNVLKMPAPAPFPMMGGLPNGVIGSSKPIVNTASAPTTPSTAPKRGRAANKPSHGSTCPYVMTKGANPGGVCGKVSVAPEYEIVHCKACLNKTEPKNMYRAKGITDEAIEKLKKGDLSGLTQGTGISTLAPTKPAITAPTIATPNLREIDANKGLFILEDSSFPALFCEPVRGSKVFICVGVYIHGSDQNPHALTKQQEQRISDMGFTYKVPHSSSRPETNTVGDVNRQAPAPTNVIAPPTMQTVQTVQSNMMAPPPSMMAPPPSMMAPPPSMMAPPVLNPSIPQAHVPVFGL